MVDICPIFRLTPATFTCEAPCTVPTVSNAAAGGICKEAVGRILGEWESRYCNQMAKQQNIAFVAIDIATATLVPTLNMHAYEHVRSKHVALTPFFEAKDKIMPFTTCSTQCAAGYTATATSLMLWHNPKPAKMRA